MITYELVLKFLLPGLLCFTIAIGYFIWQRNAVRKGAQIPKAKGYARLFGWSFCLLGGFFLFFSLFFLVAG